MTDQRRHPGRRLRSHLSARAGLTLIEAVISILLVGVLLVGTLQTLGAAHLVQKRDAFRGKALALGQDIMAEILAQPFTEDSTVPFYSQSIGRESEAGGDRLPWDDVDDYDGWDASPPEQPDGSPIPGFTGWSTHVSVQWANPFLPDQLWSLSGGTGLKRITVVVTDPTGAETTLVALRSIGWQTAAEQPAPSVLYVTTYASLLLLGGEPILYASDQARIDLIKSWGYTVETIDARSTQTDIDAAAARHSVAYLSAQMTYTDLGTKLESASIGLVIEEPDAVLAYGLAGATGTYSDATIRVNDGTHYVTSTIGEGERDILDTSGTMNYLTAGLATGVAALANDPNAGGANPDREQVVIATLDTGGAKVIGGSAAGRRVFVPWGGAGFDISDMNSDGQTLWHRAIDWAAGWDTQGG